MNPKTRYISNITKVPFKHSLSFFLEFKSPVYISSKKKIYYFNKYLHAEFILYSHYFPCHSHIICCEDKYSTLCS